MKPDIIQQLQLCIEIEQAKQAGNPIEWEVSTSDGRWINKMSFPGSLMDSLADGCEIRIKPWTLGRSVNGHTLPDDKSQWHRQDFTQAMLPPPYRPLLPVEFDNKIHNDIERAGKSLLFVNGEWRAAIDEMGTHYYRTTRPIPVVDPYAELKSAHAAGSVIQQVGHGSGDWFDCGDDITWTRPPECYRIKPAPVMVDLGPEDVPIGSAFRRPTWYEYSWAIPQSVCELGVEFADRLSGWDELRKEGWLIHRPSSPDLWQRCEKLAPN